MQHRFFKKHIKVLFKNKLNRGMHLIQPNILQIAYNRYVATDFKGNGIIIVTAYRLTG